MDFEAKYEKNFDNEKSLKEDVVSLKEQLKGKDQAIEALGTSLIEKGKEQERISEMFTLFKNKVI